MPKQLRFFFLFITLITFLPAVVQAKTAIKTSQKTIILDPGHGGKDTGITTNNGIIEKQVTLELAKAAAKLLENDYNIVFTRAGDTEISFSQRLDKANRNKAHLFVSIHLHHHPEASGFVYTYSPPDGKKHSSVNFKKTPDTVWMHHLASSKKASDAFGHIFNGKNKSPVTTSQAPVIGIKGADMPAVLVEPFCICILSEQTGQTRDIINEYAVLIAKSIDLYFLKTGLK